eukprot:TRINITY_DN14035_c0_g1_i2.p1 TRINITY_DN14035_c0_g1~~TRINITY_DN14035_c0_g1_i2.p1  ORF type:complete len:184 (-),score=16.25 TRINITY_DN14035_c0_g1_i2:46-597(-)
MGSFFSRIMNYFFSDSFSTIERQVLCVGLDGAGKTTILYRLKDNATVETIPTIGFNVETVRYGGTRFMVWDFGGQSTVRRLWRHSFESAECVIYVVDSSDRDRFVESGLELESLLGEPLLQGVPVAVLCNKQDIAGAARADDILTALHLHGVNDRQIQAFETCAITGMGLNDAMEWVAKHAMG